MIQFISYKITFDKNLWPSIKKHMVNHQNVLDLLSAKKANVQNYYTYDELHSLNIFLLAFIFFVILACKSIHFLSN